MQLFVVKLIGLIALLFSSLLFGYLPTIITKRVTNLLDESRRFFYQRLMSLISCFGGGVFLTTCLLDLFPDVETQLKIAFDKLKIETDFPCSQFIIIIGFLIVLIIEQIVLTWKEVNPEIQPLLGHSHSFNSHSRDGSVNEIETEHQSANKSVGSLRTMLLVLALSLHSVFEGLAIGLQQDIEKIVQVLVAVLIHKSIIAFTLGLNLVTSQEGIKFVTKSLILFSVMSPLGVAIGMAIINLDKGVEVDLVSGILQGIACGTFLYVTFFEILPHELNSSIDRLLKLLSIILGFSIISVLIMFLPA